MKRFFYSIVILAWFAGGCSKETERNKVYVLSPQSQQMHVFNGETLLTIIAQPLNFSGVGVPIRFTLNQKLHQVLVVIENSRTLVRIGTEPPFGLSALPLTTYGSDTDVLLLALPNPAQENNVLLTSESLVVIDAFGASVSATTTPTPTATPTATATPTPTTSPTASPTPIFPLTVNGRAMQNAFVALPSGCGPLTAALNVASEFTREGTQGESETSSTTSASPTPTATASASPSSESSDNESLGSGEKPRFVGGTRALVVCQTSGQALIYDTQSLSLLATLTLASGAGPLEAGFVRTADETGDTVTGTFIIWNSNRTIDLISSSSSSLLSGSPFTITASAASVISTFGIESDNGLILTGYGTVAGAFVDVRDKNGAAISGSPFALSSDCAITGPGGVLGQVVSLKVEKSSTSDTENQTTEDVIIHYTCPTTGLVGTLSTNFGVTYLMRSLGAGTSPKNILLNPLTKVLYVNMIGATAPGPGLIGLDPETLGTAIAPVTFTTALPEQMLIFP